MTRSRNGSWSSSLMELRWWYGECPPHMWEEFASPATSKGQYIHTTLDGHPKGRFEG